MDTIETYYTAHPMERLERDIEGLAGFKDLLQASELDMVKKDSIAMLVEIIQEDMAQALADHFKLQQA